jgi:hypothetical protein
MGTGVKWPGREASNTPPSSAKVKNWCSCTFTSQYVFMVWCLIKQDTSFETSAAVMFQVEVLWVVTPYSVVVGYHRFRCPFCLHLQGEVTSETSLHGVTTQKTSTWSKRYVFMAWCLGRHRDNFTVVSPLTSLRHPSANLPHTVSVHSQISDPLNLTSSLRLTNLPERLKYNPWIYRLRRVLSRTICNNLTKYLFRNFFSVLFSSLLVVCWLCG